MITLDRFMGGGYDPTATPLFKEQGRVILIPAAHGATVSLPSHYSKFNTDSAWSALTKKFSGGPCFYVINLRAGVTTVQKDGGGTWFTVPANTAAIVTAGATSYVTIDAALSTDRQISSESRSAVTAAPTETINSDPVCGDPVYKLTDCAAVENPKYVDDDAFEAHLNKAVQISSDAGVWWVVSLVDPLPSGEAIESVTVTAIRDSGCEPCDLAGGTQFNGYIGPAATAGESNWTRLEPSTFVPTTEPSATYRACNQLWIYEGVYHNGSEYILSGASTVTTLRTPSGSSTEAMRAFSARNAYSPMYAGWTYVNFRNEEGIPTGALLSEYPYYWESRGSISGQIGGYEIDIMGPSHDFDLTARGKIYATLNTDLGVDMPASGSGNLHTLLLYVRCNSIAPSSLKQTTNPVTWWSNYRDPWNHSGKTVYALNDEIRPGTTGSSTDKQMPTSGFAFRCTTAGTIGGVEPTWADATAIGDTINDGSVVWTAVPVNYLQTQSIYLLSAHIACDP